jgi:hypothetical protein
MADETLTAGQPGPAVAPAVPPAAAPGAPTPEQTAAAFEDLNDFGLSSHGHKARVRSSELGPIYSLDGSEPPTDPLRWVF